MKTKISDRPKDKFENGLLVIEDIKLTQKDKKRLTKHFKDFVKRLNKRRYRWPQNLKQVKKFGRKLIL